MADTKLSPKTGSGTTTAPDDASLSRNPSTLDDCVKANVAETSRLDDQDDACFDSIG